MEPITIREIIAAVDGKLLGEFTDLDQTVTHVFTDSRKPDPGALFIPLVGERFDGHAFINDALEGGAAGCFTQRERESYLPGKFYIKVNSTQKALRDLARWYKRRFSIPFVAITGSVGKTTTKDMVAAVLGERFKVLKTEGNFNNEVGLPLTLLRLNSTHEICVLEMGMNHFGEIEYLSAIVEPDVAIITNIGDSHIENLGSRENILKAKCEIFSHMDPEKGFVILNGDDPLLAGLRPTLAFETVSVGTAEGLEYRATDVSADGEKSVCCHVTTPSTDFDAQIPALGSHMLYPTLPAAAVAAAEVLHIGDRQRKSTRPGLPREELGVADASGVHALHQMPFQILLSRYIRKPHVSLLLFSVFQNRLPHGDGQQSQHDARKDDRTPRAPVHREGQHPADEERETHRQHYDLLFCTLSHRIASPSIFFSRPPSPMPQRRSAPGGRGRGHRPQTTLY